MVGVFIIPYIPTEQVLLLIGGKQNVDELTKTINKEIDTLSSQFKKIYVSSNGYINNGNGEITVQLRIQERE